MALEKILRKELSTIISSGQAFQNPLQNNINISRNININGIFNSMDSLTDRLLMPRIVIGGDLNNMFTLFITTINNYELHTNQLCGVNLDSSKNIYSILMLTQSALDLDMTTTAPTITTPSYSIKNTGIDVGNKFPQLTDSNPFSKVLGCLRYSPEYFNTIHSLLVLVNTTVSTFLSENYYDQLLLLDDAARELNIKSFLPNIISLGNSISTTIQNRINADIAEYNLMQRIVLANAITENIASLTTSEHTADFMNKVQTSIFYKKIPKI